MMLMLSFLPCVRGTEGNEGLREMGMENIRNKATYQPCEEEGEVSFSLCFITFYDFDDGTSTFISVKSRHLGPKSLLNAWIC